MTIQNLRVWTVVFVLASGGAAWAESPGQAAAASTEGQDSARAAAAAAAAAKVKANTKALADAATAADAAVKAAEAARKAITDAEAADTAAKGALGQPPERAAAIALAKTAASSAAAAATQAVSAADAALVAQASVTAEPAKGRAARAASDAQLAAKDARSAADAASTAASTQDAASTPEKTKAAVSKAAEETAKAGRKAIEASEATTTAAMQASQPDLPVTDPSDQDILSALRARITGGSIFTNGTATIVKNGTGETATATVNSPQFAQAALYLAFEAQPNLWQSGGRACKPGKNAVACEAGKAQLAARGYPRQFLDGFANVRLTTIPVTATPAAPNTPTPVQVPDVTFLQSQKAAQIQLGAVYGWNLQGFDSGDTSFHLSVGPVFRASYQSVTDVERAQRVWDVDDDLFDAWTYGVRLALLGKPRADRSPAQSGWTPNAYIDLTLGHFQNFETPMPSASLSADRLKAVNDCLANTSKCLAGTVPPKDDFNATTSNRRLYVEARLVMKYLYLGFDLNNGRGHDDLRFVAGLSVQLDQFFRRQ